MAPWAQARRSQSRGVEGTWPLVHSHPGHPAHPGSSHPGPSHRALHRPHPCSPDQALGQRRKSFTSVPGAWGQGPGACWLLSHPGKVPRLPLLKQQSPLTASGLQLGSSAPGHLTCCPVPRMKAAALLRGQFLSWGGTTSCAPSFPCWAVELRAGRSLLSPALW